MWKMLLRDCCLPEQIKLRPKVETESDEVDTKHPPTLNLEIEDDRGRLSIAYLNYPTTGQRIAVIEGKFMRISSFLTISSDHILVQHKHKLS